MIQDFQPNRYAVIHEKNPREIVMLRGTGCQWRKCRFCDYHLDSSKNIAENQKLNKIELNKVTGIYKKLEVINSGSFIDLDELTFAMIQDICITKNINEVHFECHWLYRDAIANCKKKFQALGITAIFKTGVETFDARFRESYLEKGISTEDPAEIAEYFDEVCLLFGIPGQTIQSMKNDIETGLAYFQRVCINLMQENGTPIKPDPKVITFFETSLYEEYIENCRVDILMENTAFGVGGVVTNAE